MRIKKLLGIALALVFVFSLAACAAENNPAAGFGDDVVVLRWLQGGDNTPDSAQVWAAVNEALQEFLPGTVLDITVIPFGEYEQRFQLEAAAGGQWDIAWFGWMLHLSNEVANGALMPMNDLIDRYGQNLREELPSFMFDCNTIDGNIYLIANNQVAARPAGGFFAPKELADLYLDAAAFERAAQAWAASDQIFAPDDFLDVIEDYAQQCLDAGRIMLGMNIHYFVGNTSARNIWFNSRIGDRVEHLGGFAKAHDPASAIYNYSDIVEEEIAYFERIRSWNEKGFIRRDALTVDDWQIDFDNFPQGNGYIFRTFNYDVFQAETQSARHGFEVIALPYLYPMAPTSANPTATSQSIMHGARNPERAMQFLNLLNSAEGAYIYNMLAYGIEGIHWDYTDRENGIIETYDYAGGHATGGDVSYALPRWAIGNTRYAYATQGVDPGYDRYMTGVLNFEAMPMPLSGFVFNSSAVIAEVAAVTDIVQEYEQGLMYGMYSDVRATILERNARLDAAGGQRIKEEIQRQVDAFLTNR